MIHVTVLYRKNARAEIGTEPAYTALERASPSCGKMRRLLHTSLSIVRRDFTIVKYATMCDIGHRGKVKVTKGRLRGGGAGGGGGLSHCEGGGFHGAEIFNRRPMGA